MRKMKNSGVAWIGDIPDSWEVKPIRHFLDERIEKNSNQQVKAILSLSAKEGITLYNGENHSGNKPREDLSDYKIVRKNDIVANSMNILSGSVGLSDYLGVVSPVYYVYYNRDSNVNNLYYLYYLFQCKEFQRGLWGLGNGILVKESESGSLNTIRTRIPSKRLRMQLFPSCSKKEQDQIVIALNKNTKKIDILISNQEQQIEKLKQYKQSLITEVVTKGLNPDVTMKDSGIEWIGIISAIHNIYRLKYLLNSQMLYGANEAGSFYTNNAVRYIRITDITEDNKLKDSAENLYLSIEKAKPYILKDKDVLFARSGATVGKAFMYLNEYGKSAFAGYLIKAECNTQKLLPEYLFYYTQSSLYEYWKNMIFIQATIQNIGANKYSNMPIIQMSLDEQNQIVKFLDDKCAKIDRLIAIKQEKINKLNDYKKSLIYEYVTGKKEVV